MYQYEQQSWQGTFTNCSLGKLVIYLGKVPKAVIAMGAYTYTYTFSIHCQGPIPTTVFDGYKTYHLLGVIKSYPSKILNPKTYIVITMRIFVQNLRLINDACLAWLESARGPAANKLYWISPVSQIDWFFPLGAPFKLKHRQRGKEVATYLKGIWSNIRNLIENLLRRP